MLALMKDVVRKLQLLDAFFLEDFPPHIPITTNEGEECHITILPADQNSAGGFAVVDSVRINLVDTPSGVMRDLDDRGVDWDHVSERVTIAMQALAAFHNNAATVIAKVLGQEFVDEATAERLQLAAELMDDPEADDPDVQKYHLTMRKLAKPSSLKLVEEDE